ncbi:hypothetical protein BG015_002854 [Linnemannia schmuckeri]|uniref:Uncharacterized protein n=1 Tax=Linnemannia schmuckeri TaxID=64567 RepID=A0A9P5V632_9FUNG|nr:hypothetical protein BG015_002854 [Linnemannia schmuckeri]
MNYTLSSSFNYTPDVVDIEAMNITDMFPEQSSFSFDMSNSYSDSISGIPLAQQALWDDGQLTLPNSSRVFNSSSLSSSVNSSINYGHPQQQQQHQSQHLRVPSSSSHHGRHHHQPHPLSQQYQGSPLRGDGGYLGGSQDDEDDGGYDVHGDESSGHLAWMDDTKDQQGIMLHYNDQERRDEQHLQFLQDIGAGSVSRGDSISLFDELNDASELSCDLFKEQIDIDETRDQSRLPFEHHTLNTHSQSNNAGGHLENEIFDREFMASLNAPPPSSFSPMDSSAFNNPQSNIIRRNPNNILDGLHSIPVPVLDHDESIHLGQRKHGSRYDGSERSGTGETYQRALKSFFDSLKVADPIKTPHKFAPQPLPILWNEPKIRPKNLPSFNLADYKDVAKATMPLGTPTSLPPFKSTTTANGTDGTAFKSAATGLSNGLNGNTNRDSFSSSPTNTHSMPNSAHSSPLSSISTSPPTAGIRSKMPLADPKTPTPTTYTSKLTYSPMQDKEPESPQQQQLSPTTGEQRVRSKRRSTILNPHLAFDPTIPPAERAAADEVTTPSTPRGTLERRSTLQQAVRPKVSASEDPKSDEDTGANGQQPQQQGTIGKASPTTISGFRGPVVRKRRSLHQDMFINDDGQGADCKQADQEQQQHYPKEDFFDGAQGQQQHQDEALAHRSSRPQSMNILPESLTSVNNHAFHQEEIAKVERVERARRLSEEERHAENSPNDVAPTSPSASALTTASVVNPASSRIPAALTLGRAAGARFGRSGSGSAGSLAQMSPTTPTASNPYGSLNGRTGAGAAAAAVAAGGAGSRLANGAPHRLSLTGTTAAFARQQLDDAAAAASPSTPTQAQYLPKLSHSTTTTTTTLSRNGTRSSPPTSAGLRRPVFATQQDDYNGGSGGGALSLPTEQYDDYYRAEKEFQMQQQQQPPQPPARSSYIRQQQQKQQDLEQPEWYDNNDEEHQPRRIPTTPMKSSRTQLPLPPAPLSPLDQQQQQREQREQRDQKHLQRLRIQQQALEEVYGHGSGYGNTYPDDQGGFVDDHRLSSYQQQPQQSRYQSQSSPRLHRDRDDHYRSLVLTSPPSPLPPSPRDYLSATVTTPKASSIHQPHQQSRYSPPIPSSALPSLISSSTALPPRTSEHYRRQSRDGYSLMSAPRISPPLTGLPTSSARIPSSSQLTNPRRSLSQGLSGSSTLPSRRLSTVANVGNDGLGGSSGGGIGLHGRSGSSGSLQRSNTYAAPSLPSAGGRGATGVPSLYSDGNLPSLSGSRRPVSSMMSNGGGLPQSSRRSASESLGSNLRTSINSTSSSNSEYARVFNPNPPPPLRSSIPSASTGGIHYQHQQDSYTYHPEVPLRQSSLGAGGGGHLSSRSSIASLRSGSSNSLHGLSAGSGSGSIPSSASQLRRAASMNVSAAPTGLGIGMGGGVGGTASLGRVGGMMSAGAAASRQSYQPQQQQMHQQMQMPQQRYQRTSMYSHRA